MKPANVLIEGRTAFLTDFGLTKRMGSDPAGLTRAGDVVGTIHYVAPEQIEGGPVDARSDLYSLGCLLFHCLSGEVPFARDSDVAVIYAHLSEPPPRLSAIRPDLPEGLDAVIGQGAREGPGAALRHRARDLLSAARAVIDAAGPLADTSPRGPCRPSATRPTSPPPSGAAVPAPRLRAGAAARAGPRRGRPATARAPRRASTPPARAAAPRGARPRAPS